MSRRTRAARRRARPARGVGPLRSARSRSSTRSKPRRSCLPGGRRASCGDVEIVDDPVDYGALMRRDGAAELSATSASRRRARSVRRCYRWPPMVAAAAWCRAPPHVLRGILALHRRGRDRSPAPAASAGSFPPLRSMPRRHPPLGPRPNSRPSPSASRALEQRRDAERVAVRRRARQGRARARRARPGVALRTFQDDERRRRRTARG